MANYALTDSAALTLRYSQAEKSEGIRALKEVSLLFLQVIHSLTIFRFD